MSKPVIICVDDEDIVLESLEIELKRALAGACLIETARDGEEALALLKELQEDNEEVAIVISDHIMPGMKGDELLHRIHRIVPDSLKIMLTGQADLDAVGNAIRNARLYRYIPKPWEPEDLKLTVIEAVNSYRLERELDEKQAQLVQTNRKLEELNASLEAKVSQRTADLEKEIVERKEAEAEARRANEAKSMFLANVSHEIRTPMNAILGFSEILLEKIDDPQHQSYLKSIHSSGKALLDLINDILDLSKIEANRLEIHTEPVNISDLAGEIRMLFMNSIMKKGLDLEVNLSEGLPDYLCLDQVRVRQILINLVGNAIKFTSKGHVRVTFYKDRRSGNMNENSLNSLTLVIEVEDTGIGIPEDQQELIFESFHQQNGQKAGEYGGTGLGLAITRRLVEIMHGRISVESAPEHGSLFKVLLPGVRIAQARPMDKEAVKFRNVPVFKFRPATILLVDDVSLNRMLIKGFLSDSGLNIIEADSGEHAIYLIDSGRIPDVILMDLLMPGRSGWETAKILKKRKELKHVPFIAFSASTDMTENENGDSLFAASVSKPVGKVELMTVLSRFLPSFEIRKPQQISSTTEKAENEPADSRHYATELLEFLNREARLKWEEIKDVCFIDDIAQFAQTLESKGHKYHEPILEDYGRRLYWCAQSNEFDEMESLMASFPDVVERLKEIRAK